MKNLYQFVLSLFVCLSYVVSQANAVLALESATALAQKVYDREDGEDAYSEVTMTLVQAEGRERVRELEIASKDYGKLNKGFIRFTAPRAIADTGFLSLERQEESDIQYLYLPALKRSRRIAADQKDRSFVNTDYTFEDMERRAVERDTHTLIGNEVFLDTDCWVLEFTPKIQKESQYKRVKHWIAKNSYLPLKSEFYDKKDTLFKVYEAHDAKQIDGIWTVVHSTMSNVQEGSKTTMKIKKIEFNTGLKDVMFTVPYLEKKRT